MIVADLYTDNERIIKTGETADQFEDKLSDTFWNIGMGDIQLTPYYMGYISRDDLDIYTRASVGTLSGTIATFKETTLKENFPIGYLYSETANFGGRMGTFMEEDEMITNPEGSTNQYSILNSNLRFINQMYPEYCGMDLTNTNANMYYVVAYYSPLGQFLGRSYINQSQVQGMDLSSVFDIITVLKNPSDYTLTIPNSTWGDVSFTAEELNEVPLEKETTIGNTVRIFFTSYSVPNIYRVKNGDVSSATIRIDPFARVGYLDEEGHKKTYARQIYGMGFAPTDNYIYKIDYGSSTLSPRGQAYSTVYGQHEYSGFYRAGMEGTIDISGINSLNPIAFDGNVLAIKGNSTQDPIYFLPICTLNDFKKAFCLAFKIDIGQLTPSYVQDITWATVVNPDDGFKADIKTGNITDDGFKTKLRPWQYENFQVDDFDPDEDIPEYDPSGGDWDPDTEPDEDPNDYEKNPKTKTQVPLFGQIGPRLWLMSIDEFSAIYNGIQNIMENFLLYYQDMSQNIAAAALQTFVGLGTSQNSINQLYSGFAGSSTLDAVGNVMWFPFDLTRYFHTEHAQFRWGLTNQTEFVGPYTPGDAINPPIPPQTAIQIKDQILGFNQTNYLVKGGKCTYFKHYKNFVDYAPYCNAVLYIPYCGSVHIDPQKYVGHNIVLDYLVDFNTGACLALIKKDDLVIETLPGQIGVQLPFSMANYGQKIDALVSANSQMNAAKMQLLGSTINAILGGATIGTDVMKTGIAADMASSSMAGFLGPMATKAVEYAPEMMNLASAESNAMNAVVSAQYKLDSAAMQMQAILPGTSTLSTGNEQTARLVLYQPRWLDGVDAGNTKISYGNYGHTVGFATIENTTLNKFTGLTIAESVDTTGIPKATEAERRMIQEAFKTGVYM